MKTSWKTTATGLLAIVVAVSSALIALWDTDPTTMPNWETVVAAVVAGVGLLFARNGNKTSQDAGAQPPPPPPEVSPGSNGGK